MPRNASGSYTLPSGNPVVPGTTIDASWANNTLDDIANELTNSLSRTGAGGMLAPFRIANGAITTPGLSFLNETNSGLYRNGSGSVWMSILGANMAQFSTVGLTIPSSKALTAQGNASVGGTLAVTGATTLSSTLAVTGAITATGGVVGNVTGNVTAGSGSSSFNDVTINGSLDMVAGSSATITGLSTPTNASDAANKGYVDTQDALKLSLTGGTMSGNIAMSGSLITGLGTPSSGGDATNKTYVDAQVATRLALAGGTMSGAIAMGSSKITGLGTPTADADAATKAYVDSVAQGLDVKGSVRAATTANITLSGAQTIDGVVLAAGDRVLVKDQSSAANNGIYVVASGSWARASDADTWGKLVGAFTFVEDGTVNDNSGWVCTSPPGGTLGTTAVTFEQFSGAGQITAGAGLTKTGNTLNVGTASASRIVVNTDDIDLATTGVSAGTYKSLTVDAYGRVTAGTNPTTLSGFGITDAYTKTQTDTALALKLNLSGGTMSGAIAMGTSKITGLGDPTSAQDAATKTYVDTADALKLNLAGGTMSGAIAMGTNKITGLGDPTNAQDAATKNYIDTIFGSTSSAAASAAAAASSATSATNSASAAATSASNAATSANNAASSYTTFNDQYLGSKASDPTLNNTGGALVAGNLYWNSTVNEMRVYSGSAWLAAYIPATGYLALTGGTMSGAIAMGTNKITGMGDPTSAQDAATKNYIDTALGSYLTTASAASTYQTQAGMSSYLTTASAASTYLALTGGTLTGNLTFSGAGRRITGDFSSNSTITDRLMFQSSTTNGVTIMSAIPNGTGTTARWLAYNNSDPTNAAVIGISALSTDVRLASTVTGTGTAQPMLFVMGTTEAARISTAANFLVGTNTDDTVNKLQLVGSARVQAAATQDAVILAGRAGGTSSYAVTLTPTTLSASRTLTLPDNSGTVLTTGAAVTAAQGGTGQTTYTDGQLLIGNTSTGGLSKATLTAGSNITITNGGGTITIASTGGSGSPGGSNTQVQYNSSGSFAGSANFTFDGTGMTAGNVNASSTTKGANGLYLPAANTLGFTTNTTEVARFTSGGTLNIGTTASATTGGFPTPLIYGKQLNNSSAWSGLQLESNADDSTLGLGFNGTNFVFSTSYRSTGGYKNIVIQPQTSPAATFNTNQTVKFETSISVGGVAPTTSGAGITFPATQSASTDANTLDDYEEGDWTPVVGGTATYTGQSGSYVKIGKLVFIRGYIAINAIGTGSATTITGLPFSASAGAGYDSAGSVATFSTLNTNVTFLGCNVETTSLAFVGITAAGASSTDPISVFKNGTRIDFAMTYTTT